MRNDKEELVLESLNNRVLTIALNRPGRRNAITAELVVKLHDALTRASNNERVGAIVLAGTGADFCAGGDIGTMTGGGQPTATTKNSSSLLDLGAEISLLLHRMAKPTIAMVQGVSAGGGLALAAACDMRVCSDSARFTFAYTKIGLAGDFAATYFLEKLLGTAKAREICLLCPVIDAATALQMGLVNRVCPAPDLGTETYALAEQLAAGPTFALGQVKANLNAAAELTMEKAVQAEAASFELCRKTADHREAARAFLEKRKPLFHKIFD